ncbi:AAA family ATPase [Streptomyces sp. NPDC058000]|uniref:helix-turn-helix transcriptional regulator n=1 Tax=Streptomyces sp. NPDC058000 TaxID=3346299 RepID=UPI0036E6E418
MSAISTLNQFSEQGIRRTERLRLRTVLHTLTAGRGGIVHLVGDPGTGKTRLLSELADQAAHLGLPVTRNHCTEFSQGIWGHAFHDALGDAFAPILRTAAAPAPGRAGAEQTLLLHHRIGMALHARTGTGMVILLDDFHWADPLSQGIVENLLRFPLDIPLLLVVAYRPRQTPPRLRNVLLQATDLGLTERMELGPLTLAEAANMTGMSRCDERLATLLREGAGNPLHLAFAHHELRQAEAGTDPRLLPVPEEFATPLSGEFDCLEEPLRKALQGAAVLADRFDVDMLAEVSRVSRSETCTAVTELVRRDLLRPLADSPYHGFRHDLLRRVVYDAAPPCALSFTHARAHTALASRGAPAAVCAAHVERSASELTPAAHRTLLRAAEENLDNAPEKSAHWLRVLLRTSAADTWSESERATALDALLRTLGAQRTLGDNRDLMRAALALAPEHDSPERVRAVAFSSLMEAVLGNADHALDLVEHELAGRPAEQLPAPAVPLLLQRELTALLRDTTPHRGRLLTALLTARRNADPLAQAGALALLSYTEAMTDDAVPALHHAEQSAALCDTLPDDELCAHPEYLGVLALSESLLGQFEQAGRHGRRGAALVSSHGRTFLLPSLLVGIAYALTYAGRVHQARRTALDALSTAAPQDNLHVRPLAAALESCNAVLSGEPPTLSIDRAHTTAFPHRPHSLPTVLTALCLAQSARLRGDLPRAESLILIAGSGPDLTRIPALLRPACYEVLAASAVAADNALAARWAWRAKVAAEKLRIPVPLAYAAMAQAHILRKHSSEAAWLYRRAACLFSTSGMVGIQAWALKETATCLAANHRSGEASSLLSLAAELAHQSGGRLLYDQIRRATTPTTPLPDRHRTTPCDTLTPLTNREREVASFVGTGMKTREIAQQLHLSPRTVEVHLTRIYRKLNINSRASLARLMTEAGIHPTASTAGG